MVAALRQASSLANRILQRNLRSDKFPAALSRRGRGFIGRGILSGVLTLDADAKLFIDAMAVTPSATRKTIINQFFLDIKGIGNFGTDNIFSKLDELWLFAAETEQAGLLGIKRLKDATAVNAPTFTADEGFTGADTKYINLNWNPTDDGVNYTLNDCSYGAYSRSDIQSDNYWIGADEAADSTSRTFGLTWAAVDNNAYHFINGATSVNPAATTSLGFWVGRRTASNAVQVFKNGVSFGTDTDASGSLSAVDFFATARSLDGVAAASSTHQISVEFVGAAMSATEQLNLFNSIEAYMDSLGKGVVA